MKNTHKIGLKWAAFTTGIACLATAAHGQSLLSTNGVIVAYVGDAVPDATGIPLAGLTFTPTGALGNNCGVDENGNTFFLAQFDDLASPFPDATNNKAYFYGSNRANLKMVARGADQAPSLPGIFLRTTLGTSSSLSANIKMSADGRFFWSSTLWDNGVTITGSTGNDSAIFGGPFGSQTLLVRRGDQAPGCPAGVVYTQAFSSLSQTLSGINRNGRIYFSGALTGPGVVTTSGSNNQTGLFAGLPGALELVARKSDPASGIPGTVTIDTATSINTVAQMNTAGNFLYDTVLSTTQGATPANATNDRALMMHVPGGPSSVIVREGDNAPGTFNGTSFATFNAITGDAWQLTLAPCAWTRSSQTIFKTELRGGDVVGTTNDRAIYRGGVGSLAMVQRKGDAAPGTTGVYADWDFDSIMLNDNGQICFQGILDTTIGGVTTANDTGIWTGTPGSMVLVAREGNVEPITGGTIANFNITNTQGIHLNDQGRVLYRLNLTGGTNPGNSLWLYEPSLGTSRPIFLPGNLVEVTTGVFKSFITTGIGYGELPYNNSDGAGLTLTHNGKIGLRVTFSDNTTAIMTLTLPPITAGTPFCFGDGTGTACPCANSGAVGNGCANSLNANGANLSGAGVLSVGSDSFVMTGVGMPNGPGLYFQGTLQLGAGAGVTFGDGLRCTGGSVFRLGIVIAAGNTSTYPTASAPNNVPVSVKGFCNAGDTRHYQLWYRDSDPVFCTASVFNLTNGLTGVWTP